MTAEVGTTYPSFREFDLSSGVNLKHDPALVGPAFAQRANNVRVDEDTIRFGNGYRRLNPDSPVTGAALVGDFDIHYGSGAGNEVPTGWDNFVFNVRGSAAIQEFAHIATDAVGASLGSETGSRTNTGPAGRSIIIPYKGIDLTRDVVGSAEGLTLRISFRLPDGFDSEDMDPGQGFPIGRIGGGQSDKDPVLIFGLQRIENYSGDAGGLCPFVLVNDKSSGFSPYYRKFAWDWDIRSGQSYNFHLVLGTMTLYADSTVLPMFSDGRPFDPSTESLKVGASLADAGFVYGLGEADRAVFIGTDGPFSDNLGAMGDPFQPTAGATSTTTLIKSLVAAGGQIAGYLVYAVNGTNAGEWRWCAGTNASGDCSFPGNSAWTSTPAAGNIFEVFPVVWSRYTRGSLEPNYSVEFSVSDVGVWLADLTAEKIQGWNGRSLTQEDAEGEADLVFYFQGDQGTSATWKDIGPYKMDAFFSGAPGNSDGILLDGEHSALWAKWTDSSRGENPGVIHSMARLLRGTGVQDAADSYRQFGARLDFDFWNKIPNKVEYVLGEQGTSDNAYELAHTLTSASTHHVSSPIYSTFLWRVSYTQDLDGSGENRFVVYFRWSDPSNASPREMVVSVDVTAAGDLSGKSVKLLWGLAPTVFDASPSSSHLWVRALTGTGDYYAQADYSFTGETQTDLRTTPFDEIAIGRSLIDTDQGATVNLEGRGMLFAPIKVRGFWFFPGCSYKGDNLTGLIGPGNGRRNKIFSDLGNSGSLVTVTDDSTSVVSFQGDSFNTERCWNSSGNYGIIGRLLHIEANEVETRSLSDGLLAYHPLYRIDNSASGTLTVDPQILTLTASGLPASALQVLLAYDVRHSDEREVDVTVPMAQTGLGSYFEVVNVVPDDGVMELPLSFVSLSPNTYFPDDYPFPTRAPGIVTRTDRSVRGLATYENPSLGLSQKVAAIGGAVGVLDDNWIRRSLFIDESRPYSFSVRRGEDRTYPAGDTWRTVSGPPVGRVPYSRTPIDMELSMCVEAIFTADDTDGIRMIHEITYGDTSSGVGFQWEETPSGEYYTRFYIEDGIPKFAYKGANGGTETILKANATTSLVEPGKESVVAFTHQSSLSTSYFFVNGSRLAAIEEVGTHQGTGFTANPASYTANTGYFYGVLGASRPHRKPFQHALGGSISRMVWWGSAKRTVTYDINDLDGEATTGALMYLKLDEGRGNSLADSEGSAHMDVLGNSFQPFFVGPIPDEPVSMVPFGGRLFFAHKGILPQVWDGEVVVPAGLAEPPTRPKVTLFTESITVDGVGSNDGVNHGDGGEIGFADTADKRASGYFYDNTPTNGCGLTEDWKNRGLRFGGNHWLEAEEDNKFSLGERDEDNYIVLQGWFRPKGHIRSDGVQVLIEARHGIRDGWGFEMVGHKMRFRFWDKNVNAYRAVTTVDDIVNEGNWHYFYFRYKIKDGEAETWNGAHENLAYTGGGVQDWTDTVDYDSFVVFGISTAWTYVHSIAETSLDFDYLGEGNLFHADNATTDAVVNLRIGGTPLSDDPYNGLSNFFGTMDTIQGQIQNTAAECVIERLFVDSAWGGANTDANGNWSPVTDTNFNDIARPTAANVNETWAWSIEHTEGGKGFALSKINLGDNVGGVCVIDQEGSFLAWKFNVTSTGNVANPQGSHQFSMTFYSPDLHMESPASPIATSVAPDGGDDSEATIARWEIAGLPRLHVKGIRIWRRIYKTQSNQPIHFLAHEIKDNSTRKVEIAPGEEDLVHGIPIDLETFNPPRCSLMEASENTMFYSGVAERPETIIYSRPFYPWSVRPENIVLSESGDGTEVRGVRFFRGNLIAFTARSVYAVSLLNFGFTLTRTNSVAGAVGPGGITEDGEELLLIGSRGFYRGGSPGNIRYEGWVLENFFKDDFAFNRGHEVQGVFNRSSGVIYFLCPTKDERYPVVLLRGFKNDKTMGMTVTDNEKRSARYAWSILRDVPYVSMAQSTDVDGKAQIMVGTPFGGVGYLEDQAQTGIESEVGYSDYKQTTMALTVTDITANVVTVSDTLMTRGCGLVGSTLELNGEVALIKSNTASTMTVDRTLSLTGGSTAYLGAVTRDWWSGWLDFGPFEMRKRGFAIDLQFHSATTTTVTVNVYKDFETTPAKTEIVTLDGSNYRKVDVSGLRGRYFSFQLTYSQSSPDWELLRAGFRQAPRDHIGAMA